MIQELLTTIVMPEMMPVLPQRRPAAPFDIIVHDHSYEIVGQYLGLSLQQVALRLRDNVFTILVPAPLAARPGHAQHDEHINEATEHQFTLPSDADVSKLIIALDDDFFRIIVGRFVVRNRIRSP